MKSCFSLDMFMCTVLLVFAFVGLSAADLEQNKNRRAGGNSGLYAFPRVGRSDPSMAESNLHDADALAFDALASLEDYEEYPKTDKRAGLIAFPRVGRNDVEMRKWARLLALQQALEKRTGPSANSGLWFGPRLGKRSVDEREFQLANAEKGQKENY